MEEKPIEDNTNKKLGSYSYLIYIFIGFIVLILGLYNQPYYPQTWLDEGFVLQGPINLLRYGKYAMKSVEGFRILDQPLIPNGPGIVLPLTLMFKLFGIGLIQARMLMVGFLLFTAFSYFFLSKYLYGTIAGLISILLLIALPVEGFIWFGRQTLGNIPALGYFCIGYILWLRSLDDKRILTSIGAGLLFGLTMITKGQYTLIIPVLIILAFFDWVYYKQIGIQKFIIVLLTSITCYLLWHIVQGYLVGWENWPQHIESIRGSARVTVYAFRFKRIPGTIWFLMRSGIAIVIVPGFLYMLWLSRQRTMDSIRSMLLILFILVWSAWFVIASVGWPRYAIDLYAAGAILTGKFLKDVIRSNQKPLDENNIFNKNKYIKFPSFIILIAIIAFALFGFVLQIKGISSKSDKSPQLFAAFLQKNIGKNTVIESWEWELDTITDLNFHHPTNDWVDKYTAILQYNENIEVNYDPFEYNPVYLIDGPFSKWTGIYSNQLANGCCDLLNTTGPYDLYRINN